jgi:long-chain acyl-CoA synthetase
MKPTEEQTMEVPPQSWLAHYPQAMPSLIDPDSLGSVKELLRQAFSRFAERPAYTSLGHTMSWRETDVASRDFGAALQHVLGLRRGERVAVMMPNLLQHPVCTFAALRAGLVVVNVNPLYTARELAHQLLDSGAAAIVVLEHHAHVLEQVMLEHPGLKLQVVVTATGDLLPPVRELVTNLVVRHVRHQVPAWRLPGAQSFKDLLEQGSHHLLDDLPLKGNDTAFLQYTGGTTGVAKGAVLTHRNIVANVLQLAAWIARDLREGEETALMPLPLYHAYALTCHLVFMRMGAHMLLVANPRDPAELVGMMRRHAPTVMIGVNSLYRSLLDAPGFDAVDLHHLKVCAAGGMAVQRVVAQRWKARAGVPLVEGYGLTEASPVVSSNRLDIVDWTGSVGLPLPSTDVCVLDDAGRPLATGAVGEIAVRGPQVMQGYWRRPEETRQVFAPGGWLRTGDIGFLDPEGALHVTDRKKDMIVVSGFKVYPNEVEEVVAMHPGVAEVAAIGVPDAAAGEVVKLVVQRRDSDLTAEQLIEHCRKYLTGYKVPRRIEFRAEPLPKSPIGKVLRRELREAPEPREPGAPSRQSARGREAVTAEAGDGS